MFSGLVACYLFLAGAASGAGLVLGALTVGIPRDIRDGFLVGTLSSGKTTAYRRFFTAAYAAALVALALGALCLMLDLGRPQQVLLLFVSPTLSFMTLGAYALFVALCLLATQALTWAGVWRMGSAPFCALQVFSVLACAVVAVYAGLLLSNTGTVPLWSSVWLPVLFVLSALSCGIALVLASAQLSGAGRAFATVTAGLLRVDGAVVVFEALAAGLLVLAALDAAGVAHVADVAHVAGAAGDSGVAGFAQAATDAQLAAASSVFALTYGSCSQAFWGGFALLGLAVPFVLDIALARAIVREPNKAVSFARSTHVLVAAFCVLLGGFALRWCIVSAGVSPAAFLGV